MKYVIVLLALCALGSCQPDTVMPAATEVIARRHFNILIAPDLSNRLSSPGLIKDDVFLVQQFISLLYPELINDDSKIYQNDVFRLDFVNKRHISEYGSSPFIIDLARFKKDQIKRNGYLGINEHSSPFQKDTASFVRIFKTLIDTVKAEKTYGSDIYGYLESLNDIQIDTTTEDIDDPDTKERIHNYHTNAIVLLTDGYIETSNNNDPERSLSQTRINSFRTDYIHHGHGMPLDSFLQQNRGKYEIAPIRNPLLQSCRILVLQLCDRGQSAGANKNSEPTDLKIIRVIWKDWLINSGLSPDHIELHSCDETDDAEDTKKIFRKFLLKK